MFTAQRPRGVRLGVSYEGSALVAALGAGAYAVACARAQEASSDDMARDWSDVASVIARRTKRRAGRLAALLD